VERNADGTFAKGNSGGPGRPKRSTEDKYLKKLISRCTLKDWQKIVDTAISRAQAGDNVARAWLSDYLLGKPKQSVDVTTAGEKVQGAVIYLPAIDDVETESGPTGEVSS